MTNKCYLTSSRKRLPMTPRQQLSVGAEYFRQDRPYILLGVATSREDGSSEYYKLKIDAEDWPSIIERANAALKEVTSNDP